MQISNIVPYKVVKVKEHARLLEEHNWYKRFLNVQKKPKEKEMTIDITISLPKVTKPKRKVRVFSNFVKVGFEQYSIKIDPFTGYEYVKIEGKRYEILRDFFNRGVLVEI